MSLQGEVRYVLLQFASFQRLNMLVLRVLQLSYSSSSIIVELYPIDQLTIKLTSVSKCVGSMAELPLLYCRCTFGAYERLASNTAVLTLRR